MKENKKSDLIICPNCGAEYLANEIFIPENFFGKTTYIDREEKTNKILDYNGSMNLKEHYICDYCSTPFNVRTTIKFTTFIDESGNFNQDYFTVLEKNSLFLDEE